MTIDQLNSRYGAPGRIVFHAGFAGYPNVVLANQYGTAEVALLGANVLSYRPTGHGPVLFLPARRDYNRGDTLHGGIPTCWPQFGNRFSKEIPQHGFARKLVFDVRGTEYSEEKTELTLGLKSTAETRKLWPHDFDFTVTVTVSMKLNLRMTTVNTGTEPFAFSCGFHPYFLVRNRDDVRVRGVAGLDYFNGVTGVSEKQTDDLAMNVETDHIFTLGSEAKHEHALLDPGLRRAIALVSSGNDRTVIWNPGPGLALPDLAADDWKRFVCVEPVSDWPGGRRLAPGARHELLVAIQSVLDGLPSA